MKSLAASAARVEKARRDAELKLRAALLKADDERRAAYEVANRAHAESVARAEQTFRAAFMKAGG